MIPKTCTSCGDDFPATKDYGYTSSGRSPSIPGIKITAARALYGAGFDVEYIADDLGVSRDAVKSLFWVTA